MPENEEPDLQIPEDASSLECSAIVIPAAYIDRPNSEAPLSEASHEFTQKQVDEIINRGLDGLPVTVEHCDDKDIMENVGRVEEVWKSDEGDLCARFRVRLDTIPGRAVARMVQGAAKGAVSLRHDIVPAGNAQTPEGHVVKLGKQIRELSVCQYPRREGAVITDKSYTNAASTAYNTVNRTHNTALVSSAASLVFTEDGSFTMSETANATPAEAPAAAAAPEVTEATPAAAPATEAAPVAATPAEVTPPPSRPTRADGGFDMRFTVNKAESQEAPKDQAEPAAPAKPEIALSGDPMVQAMATAMMNMKETWGTEMSDMKSQLQQLTQIQLANEQRRQQEVAAIEAAEKERNEKLAAEKAAADAEAAKKRAVEMAREEARLGQLYKEYIDQSMNNAEAAEYIKGLRNAGDQIFNRQVQLLESKASQKANQAQQWLSYMQSSYSGARSTPAAAPAPVVLQSAASRVAGEPAAKRRMADPAPAPAAAAVVDIPVVGSDSLEQTQEPQITHVNDIFRANPCMGYQEGLQLGQRVLQQDYIVRSQASLQVEAPSGSTESVQLKELNPMLTPDIMEFSPEFRRLWDDCERSERMRGARASRPNIAMVPVKN